MVTKEKNNALWAKTILVAGEKNSYDRQFVRCGVNEDKNTKIGKFCTTQHENTLTDAHQFPLGYLVEKQKQTKKTVYR